MIDNGTMRTRKPQLADSIQRLDEMVDQLSAAIPAAVGEAVREVMGGAVAAAIREAVADGVRQALAGQPAQAPQPATVMQEPQPTRTGVWTRVKSILGRLKHWAGARVAPVLARLAVGWAVMKLIGGATVRSRAATIATATAGASVGLFGFACGPVASAVLLGLLTGAVTAAGVWAAPAVGLALALQEDGPN
jgi:hypothetical protein